MNNKRKNPAIRVLVTGVGAIIGQGIVKSLRQSGFEVVIIGLDRTITPLARSLCDLCIEKPQVLEASTVYLEFWLQLIAEHSVDLVIPGLEVDVFFLDQHRQHLVTTGLVLNNSSLIDLTKDKWSTVQFLQRERIACIPSVLPENCASLTRLASFI